MATGVIGTNNQTVTTAANFIPELWSDEVIASYQKNLVLANLVTRINHKGKKGDKKGEPEAEDPPEPPKLLEYPNGYARSSSLQPLLPSP